MIDRGFVKWRPFNSLIPLKDTIKDIEREKKCGKPTLFPEEESILNESLIDAYYAKDIITITYYEAGKIKNVTSTIKKINPNSKTVELGCRLVLSFHQIIHVSS